ncbi:tRNA (adenosine(37)-N6)-dimethylallyltransferase MiaA [Virgibacillus dakarensis]|uniref:tRNA dimethylallyltransferase n=1 Tax=Lentibacillus populi TaxID=1827502 RepID=A0A9W5X3Y7_9BACI|nr:MULTISPECIES: tRNA (adenosine(37)-N6)-dimethylallyltransferase MiaA [Bacillaceae]MBT2215026.1 tRNA (adenosine(37)-N6)-dimethylallyltransferase MiaA [Virgibacillus dakarensis]MTW84897.1 tRNA (adenosine(37)-N6)-dimethylallyltransferase MiaA [Virgibacillus dakarensis]GGB30952.1 tRNA dimethylallyltransferase [Lentibacillus populi]
MKQNVIAVVGPTAVGKTQLSIEIAKTFHGEVISGDSMQVYQGLDIGTAKATKAEMQGIPHYMIDIKKPDEAFSVADFQAYVQAYIDEISGRGHLPILAGGSGLYIQAALYDYHFSEQRRDSKLTEQLEKSIQRNGPEQLYDYLTEIDPEQAAKIHPNNHRRLIRAIEIYETTGKTMSENNQQKGDSPYNPIFIGLEMDRKLLYERINQRVDRMMAAGLLDEVQHLYLQGLESKQSMSGIGYKEFIPYLKGEQSLETAIDVLKRNSRRFAKRQYTWFKNKMDVNWYTITPDSINRTFPIILADLAGILKET